MRNKFDKMCIRDRHLRKAKEKDLLTRKQEQNRLFMSANGIDAYITSWDGLELHALEIPAKEESHKYVITVSYTHLIRRYFQEALTGIRSMGA